METEYYITGSELLFVAIYLGLGILSCRYGMKQGYKLMTALVLSYLITPVGAFILFKLLPRKS